MLRRSLSGITVGVLLPVVLARAGVAGENDSGRRLRPYVANPWYWQYGGKPVLLLGASDDDNLFQHPELERHLDAIRAAGGNYIRNTMSDRPDRGFEVYPFRRLASGKYDLEQWNEEYWKRLENLLRWTHERDIVVQIEIWDRFDYVDHRTPRWSKHPYNPKNNVNYTVEESGLATTYTRHPGSNEQPFFFTVPELRNNTVVLRYQKRQVEKLLSLSLGYPNVLYCMDNETSGRPEWGEFWARFIRETAAERGVEVYTTEMWDAWNVKDPQHRSTLDHPEIYPFVDVSQNSHNKGQKHWDNLQWVRGYLEGRPRPINTVKIYGADGGPFGSTRDALERFWRNVVGGTASSRFHRPDSGIGLNELARTHLTSARLLLAEFDVFRAKPDRESRLLSDREDNEAYLTRTGEETYAVYFPHGGAVKLDLSSVKGTLTLKWLEIGASRWSPASAVEGGALADLAPPGDGHWVALLVKGPPGD